MKEVILAKSAGFCFGVKRAVDTVYEPTGKKNVYTFGPIIHNEEVVADLERKGVRVISDEAALEQIHEGTIVIRSHGVGRTEEEKMRSIGLQVVDATCPFVKKIHRIVQEENAKDIAAWLQGQESLEDCLKACDGRVDSSSAN